MWDEQIGLYCDQFVDRGGRIEVKTPGGMIPMLGNLSDEKQTGRLVQHLKNPDEFWTEYPIPCLSKDDPDFNIREEYQGYWNGRVWPNINWLVIEGLVRRKQYHLAKELIYRTITMQVATGTPFTMEAYNPLTGVPFFRCNQENYGWGGISNDLLIKRVMGIQPNIPKDQVYIAPLFPEHWSSMRIEGLQLGSHSVSAAMTRVAGEIEYEFRHCGNHELTVITALETRTLKNDSIQLRVSEEGLPHWLDL